jgi:hypothetical protein
MAGWRDPARVVADYGSFSLTSQVCSDKALCNSCPYQASPRLGGLVHVSEFTRIPFFIPLFGSNVALSWEFVTNLDYEYSVITGKRKVSRAFPVCSTCISVRTLKG